MLFGIAGSDVDGIAAATIIHKLRRGDGAIRYALERRKRNRGVDKCDSEEEMDEERRGMTTSVSVSIRESRD